MTSVEVGPLTERRSVQERRSGYDRRIGHAQELGLTQRQLEIVEDVVAGFSNKEIAQKLSLSEDTVKHHLTNIFDKIGVSKRLELALFATHHRLIAGEPPSRMARTCQPCPTAPSGYRLRAPPRRYS